MNSHTIIASVSFFAVLLSGHFVNAQTATTSALSATAVQGFGVTVPLGLQIIAPAAIHIKHDQTNNDNVFPTQTWMVKGNAMKGLTVTFANKDVFLHSSGSFPRNIGMAIKLGESQGPATWTLGTPADQTNFLKGKRVAQVGASSNGVGLTEIDLTVSFITEEFGMFAAGEYGTTIVGTVAAN